MFIDPHSLRGDLDTLERIEKASLRLVTQALVDFKEEAIEIFRREHDQPGDIGEDITRDAMDALGVSVIPKRLFGKMDYKRARYLFLPEFAARQALFIDSKSEKDDRTATIQTSQTSMRIRHVRAGRAVDVQGELPPIIDNAIGSFLVTTIFVKYCYADTTGDKELDKIILTCIPSGMLQVRYNPTPEDTIWMAGRNAPTLGEEFRVRLSFRDLKAKRRWRVQTIDFSVGNFVWDE